MSTATLPATIPSGAGAGKPSKTVLTDGAAYLCIDCDFVGTTFFAVRAHRATHNGKAVGRPKGVANGEGKVRRVHVRRVRQISSMTVEQIDAYVTALREELAEAKARAARAEDALTAIQRTLNSVRA